MNKLFILLMFLSISIATACYKPQSTEGFYKVTTQSSADIYYTDEDGNTQKTSIAGGEWIYTIELEQDHAPDPFWFDVYVVSTSGTQDISIYVEFDIKNRTWYTKQESSVEELEYSSVVCTPWSTQCAKVIINF